ncbi:MAG: hypothetical protein ACJ789_04285, partial [Thermomicrobiales bacterium]
MADPASTRHARPGRRVFPFLALIALLAQLMIPIFAFSGAASAAGETPTATEQPTDVPAPTAVPTDTPVPPTNTPVPAPTDTPVPPPTNTATLAATNTPAPAATDTPTPKSTTPPSIASDKADYSPGELVTLTGRNWQSGETVHINVNDDDGQTWAHNVDVIA